MTQEAGITCSEVWGGNRATDAALILPGVQGWVVSRPYRNADAGGDVHYISSCGTGRITRVMLADVSGHGEQASGVASFLRSVMQRYLNHIEPNQMAAEMNQRLADHQREEGRFATAVILTFFSPTGAVTLCNAGHPSPLIFRARQGRWAAINDPRSEPDVVNFPLGVVEGAGYKGYEVTLDPNDCVLAYSDCLIEATADDGGQLGVDGLVGILNEMTEAGPLPNFSTVSGALLEAIEAHGYRMDDDLTTIFLRCSERAGGASLPERMAGIWRSVGALFDGRPIPWPELSIANLGGMLVPPLSHWRGRGRRKGDGETRSSKAEEETTKP